MIKVRRFTCENMKEGCVTDKKAPSFAFSVDSDRQGAKLKRAVIAVEDWKITDRKSTRLNSSHRT